MKNRTTTALLALIAVLLTLNLFRENSSAQDHDGTFMLEDRPYISAIAAESIQPSTGAIQRTLYRSWSDGTTQKRSTSNGVWGQWFDMD